MPVQILLCCLRELVGCLLRYTHNVSQLCSPSICMFRFNGTAITEKVGWWDEMPVPRLQ